MGQNFALNMASHGFSVSVCNRSPGKVDATVDRAKDEGDLPLRGYKEPKEFIESLAKPRKVVLLVQAGAAVDATIATLSEFMEEGDILVDCGNEWFPNSQRRAKELEAKKIMFVGMGISGGEEGARNGPSLMPGGPKEAYDALSPIISKCAAQVRKGQQRPFECAHRVVWLLGRHVLRRCERVHVVRTYMVESQLCEFARPPNLSSDVFHENVRSTTDRALRTSAPLAPATTSRWCTTGLSTETCSSLPR